MSRLTNIYTTEPVEPITETGELFYYARRQVPYYGDLLLVLYVWLIDYDYQTLSTRMGQTRKQLDEN